MEILERGEAVEVAGNVVGKGNIIGPYDDNRLLHRFRNVRIDSSG
jgi:hypothetical protein